MAAVDRTRQEESREKGACVPHHRTTRTGEMAVLGMQRREKSGDVRGKKHCRYSGIMVVLIAAIWPLQLVKSPQLLGLSQTESCSRGKAPEKTAEELYQGINHI